jgi:N-acyl-D-aspartate/D-glutamate deacylase
LGHEQLTRHGTLVNSDLVIRNGTLVDGTGAPSRRADIAIAGERITAVGHDIPQGRREIDADGLLVTPGFVDPHTHYDGQATWDPLLAPSSHHGVTTVAMGNCGVGFAPVDPSRHDWLIAMMEGVEDIPGTALHEGLRWDWESFPEYLSALERQERTIDVGTHLAVPTPRNILTPSRWSRWRNCWPRPSTPGRSVSPRPAPSGIAPAPARTWARSAPASLN